MAVGILERSKFAHFSTPGGVITRQATAQTIQLTVPDESVWKFTLEFTVGSTGAQGKIFCNVWWSQGAADVPGAQGNFGWLEQTFDSTVANVLDISLVPSAGRFPIIATLEQCFVEYLPSPGGGAAAVWHMEAGAINGFTSGTFGPTGNDTGQTSSTKVYASSTLYGATAYMDVSATGNTVFVGFVYQGPEGGGGVAAGLRWSDSSHVGDLAYVDTSSTPVIRLLEMTSGWASGASASSSSLTLAPGNAYVLVVVDTGSTIVASIVDDVGEQSCTITPTISSALTEIMFGWIGTSASFDFETSVLGVAWSGTSTVSTPLIQPDAGPYTDAQNVTVETATLGAAIYYTTDGTTPTSGSTLYTGPISVAGSQTVKAIGILPGWTNSAVASATYTIPTVTPLAGGTGTSGSLTVVDGLLVVNVLSTAAITGVTFGGTAMTSAKQISAGGYVLEQFYLTVSAGTAAIAIATSGTTAWNAANLVSLATKTLDQYAKSSGSSGTPDTGPTGKTSTDAEVAIAAFGLQHSSATWTWAGAPGFTDGAEDVTTGSFVTLAEGYTILASADTVDAALDFSGSGYTWQGLVVTYS
jgi:Chitobiase/beta-hexosaminidase C-terminal domain